MCLICFLLCNFGLFLSGRNVPQRERVGQIEHDICKFFFHKRIQKCDRNVYLSSGLLFSLLNS